MNWMRFMEALLDRAPLMIVIHISMTLLAISIAIAISLPVAVFITRPRYKKYGFIVLNILNLLQTVPPLAIIAISMPLFGLGYKPAIFALVLRSLIPITRNSIAGILNVSDDIKEAAKGMGMSNKRVLAEVELPLAMPIIITGIKTSSVLVVSTAVLAAYIGAGGLGQLITAGLAMNWHEFLIVGASLAALLAIGFDKLFSVIELKYSYPSLY